MSPHMIAGLHPTVWQNMNRTERLAALNELERQTAAEEHRPAAEVLEMPPDERRFDEYGQPSNLGLCDGSTNTIYIDPSQLGRDEPFDAVETTFHEGQHSYQNHAIQTPGYHDDPQEVEDWRVNGQRGVYYGGDENTTDEALDYSLYRWQPREANANEAALAKTDNYYTQVIQDAPGYAEHKARREAEVGYERRQAEASFGTPMVEEAGKEAMYARYDAEVGRRAEVGQAKMEPAPQTGAQAELTGPTGRENGADEEPGQEERVPEAGEGESSARENPGDEQAQAQPAAAAHDGQDRDVPAVEEQAAGQGQGGASPEPAPEAVGESASASTDRGSSAGESSDYDYGYGY